ncbi:MAG TPA: cystathionine gamma-lyase [Thermoleophilaceae bacterium]|nr:cystathionine gamma-lyase [Thermoleophilaceae bacterium]
MTTHGDGTRVVRAGLPEAEQGAPFLPGPVFAGPFHLEGEVESAPWAYTRYGNPTWERYEAALAELEGGEVVLFASGMAAAAALLLTGLRPGASVAIDRDCYLNVRRLARTHLEPRGVEVRLAHHSELVNALQGAAMVWLESPSNPKLDVYDIAALTEAARGAGGLTVVDNTTAGPLSQKVLDLGADFSLTSATKHLSGHADLMLGYVATRDADRAQALRDWRRDAGAIPGPFETWLAHRSLPTLALRMERASANALALAEMLSERDDVTGVRYPGLPGDLAHEVARRQMTGFGSVIAFDLGSRERADRFLTAAELVTEATSFGSVHTTAERRLRWGGDDVPEGYIRLSAGCEETTDLVRDVERALDDLRPPP